MQIGMAIVFILLLNYRKDCSPVAGFEVVRKATLKDCNFV